MKALLALSMSLLATSAFANSSKDWAMGVVKFNDSRIELESCGSNEGTYGFNHPTATTIFNCMGTIAGTKNSVLLIQAGDQKALFAVSNCGEATGVASEEFGNTTQKCKIQKMDLETLKTSGREGVLAFNQTWEYSEGGLHFKFKMDSVTYTGVLVDFDSLAQDN